MERDELVEQALVWWRRREQKYVTFMDMADFALKVSAERVAEAVANERARIVKHLRDMTASNEYELWDKFRDYMDELEG